MEIHYPTAPKYKRQADLSALATAKEESLPPKP